MKNEGASLMKCDKPHEKQSVRTSCEHSEHFMTTKLSLYVCNANTSWIEIAITFSAKSRETPVFLLFFTLLADPNRRPCHTQPHRLLTGSEHRAACGRWSGAPSRKTQRALRSAPQSSGAPYHSFPPLAKTHSLRTSSSPPQKCEHFGIPPCKATMFLTVRIVGSSPTWGKNKKSCRKTGFLFCIIQYLSFVKCAWFQWNAPFRHFWKICFE